MGAMQELAQVRLAQPVTKWAAEVSDIRKIPSMVEEAYRVATTGRPGPVPPEFAKRPDGVVGG